MNKIFALESICVVSSVETWYLIESSRNFLIRLCSHLHLEKMDWQKTCRPTLL